MYKFLISLLIFITTNVTAHQFTPTYPEFEPSFVEGVMQTKMELFNKRSEIEYYELGVFDKDWAKVTFATSDTRIIRIGYLETKNIDIYVKNQDIKKVVYICTESRILKDSIVKNSLVSSKICSKVRQ
jgi:hypothetical protein